MKATCILSFLIGCSVLSVESEVVRPPVPDKTTDDVESKVDEPTPTNEDKKHTTLKVGGYSCSDKNSWCEDWAQDGECDKEEYKSYMTTNCEESCGLCGLGRTLPTTAPDTCEDEEKMCGFWSKNGECDAAEYQSFMSLNCKKSCGLCDDQVIITTAETIKGKPGITPPPKLTTKPTAPPKPTTKPTAPPKHTTSPKPSTCVDKDGRCELWVKGNYCTHQTFGRYMMQNCRKSCQACDQVETKQGPCTDDHKTCGYWYLTGQCVTNSGFMNKNCKRSCGICSDGKSILGCRDARDECKYWASIGECTNNHGFMLLHCRVSCKACTPDPGPPPPTNAAKKCEDVNTNCKEWTKKGECTRNPIYMKENCAASCKSC